MHFQISHWCAACDHTCDSAGPGQQSAQPVKRSPVGSGCMLERALLTRPVSLRTLSALKQGTLDGGQASMRQAVRAAAGSRAAGHIGASTQKDLQFRNALEDMVKDVGQGKFDSTQPTDGGAAARQWSLASAGGPMTRSGRAAASAGTLAASQGQGNTSHGVQVA